MTLEIQVLGWEQVDLDDLAFLAWKSRRGSPLWVEGQTAADFKDYLRAGKNRWPQTTLVCARQDQKLVGWLGVITEDPLIYELWRWHPFLLPEEDLPSVAQGLLLASIGLTRYHGAQSLEVCCHLNQNQLGSEAEDFYRLQGEMYQKAGLKMTDETVHMTCSASECSPQKPASIPEPFLICNYHPSYHQQAYTCYLAAFSAGSDRSILHKTPEQREAAFEAYLAGNLNTNASKLLLEDGQVRGISLIQTRERVGDEHLALLAIAPEIQGQGWGRILASSSMETAAQGGDKLFSVGVDLTNQPAYRLYQSLGFKTQTKLITHTWKNSL